MNSPHAWHVEDIYDDGDSFFSDLLLAIEESKSSIELESYIFDSDPLGEKVSTSLARAAARGVKVRIIVDAIGSPLWSNTFGSRLLENGASYQVFHRLPWSLQEDRSSSRKPRKSSGLVNRFLRRLRLANRRNHRKVVVVDGKVAFVGSMNISRVHLPSLMGDKAWRDTSVRLEGPDVKILSADFERVWNPSDRRKLSAKRRLLTYPSDLVRLNSSRTLRRRNYRELLRRLREAEHRIWITTPYFVPSRAIMRRLQLAARRGVDVRLLLPDQSDVFFMPWVALSFSYALTDFGVRVYRFLPRVLHAKTALIDDWPVIGSSNLNARSLLHDLEADVVLTKPESIACLKQHFERDIEHSRELCRETMTRKEGFLHALGRVLLLFRYWL